MENLKELIYVVNRNKIKQIDLLELSESNPTKVNQLYQLISNGLVNSDQDAFEQLYPHATSKSAFYNLKGVLRDKLLNTLFFIDAYQNNYTDRQSAFYESYKNFAASQLLLAKNARKVGVQLLEKVLKIAEQYEFTELAVLVSRTLRFNSGTRDGNEKMYHYYHQRWNKYQLLEQLESKAELYYTDLVIHYVNSKDTKKELQELAKRYYAELAENLSEASSYKYYFYTSLVQLFSYTCVNDYPSTFPICQQIINYFEQKSYTANTPIQICLHHQLVACMQTRQYEQGEKVARRSQQLLEDGSFNWFKNLEYLILMAMHTGKYQQGYKVFHEAVSHKRFQALPENVREIWNLYRAYIHLLIDMGKVTVDADDKEFTSFRINRFLNDMPLFSKDKRGMNIAILIVQILFYIQKGKYDTAIDRMEAIEKYCSRYLFKADTMRSYYFIKLLLIIPQASFHRKAVIRYAESHLKKLRTISTEVSHQYHKIEIIPYENLWSLTLSTLGTSIVNVLKLKRQRRIN